MVCILSSRKLVFSPKFRLRSPTPFWCAYNFLVGSLRQKLHLRLGSSSLDVVPSLSIEQNQVICLRLALNYSGVRLAGIMCPDRESPIRLPGEEKGDADRFSAPVALLRPAALLFFAVRSCHASEPKGWPRWMARRTASSSAAVSGRCTRAVQSRGRGGVGPPLTAGSRDLADAQESPNASRKAAIATSFRAFVSRGQPLALTLIDFTSKVAWLHLWAR
jgi:hypothetical protein